MPAVVGGGVVVICVVAVGMGTKRLLRLSISDHITTFINSNPTVATRTSTSSTALTAITIHRPPRAPFHAFGSH